MTICFFSHYSITNQDGATLSMYNIIDELLKRGIKVIVVLANTTNLEEKIKEGKIKFIKLPMYGMRMDVKQLSWTSKIKFAVKHQLNERCVSQAIKILNDENIDVIHINGLDSTIGAKTAKKMNIPYIWHIRQFMEADLGKCLYEEKNVYKLANQAASVIAISKEIQNKFQPLIGRDLDLIYNGVPTKNYVLYDIPRFQNETVRILLAGRISEQKGQMSAIKAIEFLRDQKGIRAELTLVGKSETKEYLAKVQKYIYEKQLENQITILDHVEDLRNLRMKHDIGLTCSKKEAFGRVTVENQMAGMLVIGADSGGTVEIIEDGVTGFLYEEGSEKSLAERIEFAVNNKEESKRIAATGQKQAIKEYSIERVVNQIENLYNRVI